MKKKVLILSMSYYPHVGGAEVAIKEITDRLAPDEYEFHLIANRYDSTLPKMEQVGNVLVYRIGFARPGTTISETFKATYYLVKILYVPLATLKAWRLQKKHQYDAFWSMMLYMSYPVMLLRFFRVRRPYILTLQEGDTFERVFERWFILPFKPLLLKGIRDASVVQSISTFLSNWATRVGFVGRNIVIPNAVNTDQFSKEVPTEKLKSIQQLLGKKESDVLMVTTSRLVRKNGVDTVIEALPLLPYRIQFVVFGTGPEEQKLKLLAKALQVEDRVQFLGQIGHEEMPDYLKACDIFIRPSRSEGMGNSFIEAMAAGIPVIATQEGGIADFLFDEKRNPDKEATGWAVEKENPEDIKKAVEDILSRPDTVTKVTRKAREMAMEKYDWDLIASRMKNEVFEPLFK